MAQYQLPSDFFFGAAMSGPQTEGQWNPGGKLENLSGHCPCRIWARSITAWVPMPVTTLGCY